MECGRRQRGGDEPCFDAPHGERGEVRKKKGSPGSSGSVTALRKTGRCRGSYDLKPKGKTVDDAVKFLVNDEKGRVFLPSMVSCLFARSVYTDEVLGNCLRSVGCGTLADNMGKASEEIQRLRWKLRIQSGFTPESVSILKRFTEITTWKGQIDRAFMANPKDEYYRRILEMAGSGRLCCAITEAVST